MNFDPTHKKIVPVVVGVEKAEDAEPLAHALLEGGLNVVEITFRAANAADVVRVIAQKVPEMILGAGTLLTPNQVKTAREAGAQFGVAPGLNLDVVAASQKLNMPFIPGVMTPSEVENALAAGCKLLKFFPANIAGGVPMLKALAAPYAQTGVKFIALGGIKADNMREYLAESVVAAVGGSWLVEPAIVSKRDWKAVTARTREALEIAGTLKQ
ncbi:MAG TPA: bifunctional 4-hydroxy-2-oxoglutarate aldolase/2-dehydro-3-deoxy-phosphogluconate aldolase [Verrucomicrobiae bacterium]|jgi:2-dehydro-3-deoxyphosphogluconate aldolase/(4S)-4-hydroxy-2-oxoglutarate aldolase|nr:bifunctional 4-hydroxy-2-oxoglutarate aldolase/2-dehydro-3-deoxy-phosphogluconate aldolase [Verrucomicrobiae bacterium]